MYKITTTLVLATLLIASCGKPNSPEDYTGGYEISGSIATYGDANAVVVDGNYAYVTQGEGGLAVFNVSNPKTPILVTNVSDNMDGYSTKVIKKDNFLYIAAGTGGINRVDITDPTNPIPLNRDVNGKIVDIQFMDDYLISAASESGYKVTYVTADYFDARGTIDTNGFAKGLTITADNSKLFVATGEMGLSLYDISNFEDGYGEYPVLSSVNLPGYAENVVLNQAKQVAFVSCGAGGLQVIDYSDSANIKIVGTYDCAGYAKDLVYENNKLYVTASGLQVYDVSTPADPKILGIVDSEYAYSLALDSDNIYVADKEQGLLIIPKK